MKTTTRVIKIATDYSTEPFGRYAEDGDTNGTKFREELLLPALSEAENVTIVLDGAEGYGSSFLDEAFGGLIRVAGFAASDLHRRLNFISDEDPSLLAEVWEYIDSTSPKLS